MLTHNPRLQRIIGGGVFERGWLNAISGAQLFLLGKHKEREVVRLLRRVRKERRSLLTAYECYTVYSLALGLRDRPGAMVEVGCYQGVSTKLICEAKGDKELHVFDTFEGLPKSSEADRGVHRERQYACSLESVQDYLKSYPNVHFYKGIFPDSAAGMEERQYCFAHFDVDLYEGTRACLEYFYPRMIPGGVMLSHDYSILAGVRKAFDEFLADKPESPIQQPSTQCMVIKV
jgi:hypothetical protein